MKKPSRTIDDAVLARARPRLIDIWLRAYRSKLDRIRDPDAHDFNTPLARAEYKSTTSARAARKELYKIRSKLRRKSTREHEPGSSLYDTSNYDSMVLRIRDKTLEVWDEEASDVDFTLSHGAAQPDEKSS